jgi:hypothetical protein
MDTIVDHDVGALADHLKPLQRAGGGLRSRQMQGCHGSLAIGEDGSNIAVLGTAIKQFLGWT